MIAAHTAKVARSPEELFPLIDFCRSGKLKEVSEWIEAGRPLDPPPNAKRNRRQSPLEIAIGKGFFALAELLLDGGCDPLAHGNVLADAVRSEDVEITRLLLDRSLDVNSVSLSEVFDAGRAMLELFIERGVDPSAELAYFQALCTKVHPHLFVLKEYKDRFPDLQRQAEMALSYHCEKGSPRNVGLLLWAGARPDALIPDPNYVEQDELKTCALSVAVRQGRIDILKQLKPQNYPEILKTLFSEMWEASPQLIDYLISVGVAVNTKENGGCSLIEHLLWSLAFEAKGGVYGQPNLSKMSETIVTIEHLCRLGAKWIPGNDETPRNTRDRLRKIPPQQMFALFRSFKETGAASVELLDSILDSPALRKSLGSQLRPIEDLLHPKRAASESEKAKEKLLPPTISEITVSATDILLDVVRQEPALHFSKDTVYSCYDGKALKRRLRMPKDDDRDIQPFLNRAIEKLNPKLQTFRIQIENWWGRANCRIGATLREDAEWSDALKEAWSLSDVVNEDFLTDVALDLRQLILSEELGNDWNTERSITFKIGLHGREHVLSPYLQELENKTRIPFKWESSENSWREPRSYRITTGKTSVEIRDTPVAPNPRFEVKFEGFRKSDQDAVQQLLYSELLKARPKGDESFFLFSVSTKRDFENCFPKRPSCQSLAEFFNHLPLGESLARHFDFRDGAKFWCFAVRAKDGWESALKTIQDETTRPGLDKQYGISVAAGKLLSWIKGLPADKYTGPWTPIVEDACDRWNWNFMSLVTRELSRLLAIVDRRAQRSYRVRFISAAVASAWADKIAHQSGA